MRKVTLTASILVLALSLTGCPRDEPTPTDVEPAEPAEPAEEKEIELAYVEWASEVASTNLVAAILEDELGYEVTMTPVSAAVMWQAISTDDADAMVAAWLPSTHGHYLERFEGDLVDLGPNLDGTRTGLVVPAYVEIGTIPELAENAEDFDGKIIGIDPGAGIMSATEKAIEEYEMEDFRLIESSDAAMTGALADAISNEEPVVVTGWTPHWKFSRWELKFLEDPKEIYGGAEQIHTVVREGLQEDMPDAYAFLDAFEWTPEDMADLMILIEDEDLEPAEAARRWIGENQEKVQAWLP